MEPIISPQYWAQASEPRPLPPLIKVQPGRPKKKRSRKNDIPPNPAKLVRKNTKNNCKYCTAKGHNSRSCPAKVSKCTPFGFYIPFIIV